MEILTGAISEMIDFIKVGVSVKVNPATRRVWVAETYHDLRHGGEFTLRQKVISRFLPEPERSTFLREVRSELDFRRARNAFEGWIRRQNG